MNLIRKSEEAEEASLDLSVRVLKKLKNEDSDDDGLVNFLNWCKSCGIIIDEQKVKITRIGTTHNYGMIAIKDLEANEVLVRISKSAVLEPRNTQIKDLIQIDVGKYFGF